MSRALDRQPVTGHAARLPSAGWTFRPSSQPALAAPARPAEAGTAHRPRPDRKLLLGCSLLGLLGLLALGGGLATADPWRIDVHRMLQGPGSAGLLGTDALGRSVWARLLAGLRTSLALGLTVVVANALLGTLAGLLAGSVRALDAVITVLADALAAIPLLLLALAITAAFGPGLTGMVAALSLATLPRTARLVRTLALGRGTAPDVLAARALGASPPMLLRRHVLPSIAGPLAAQLAFVFAQAMVAEAALGLLGVGPPPPAGGLGLMLAEARGLLREAPWLTLAPASTLTLVVLAANLVAEGTAQAAQPHR